MVAAIKSESLAAMRWNSQACQANRSFRPGLKRASGPYHPKASLYGHKDTRPGADACMSPESQPPIFGGTGPSAMRPSKTFMGDWAFPKSGQKTAPRQRQIIKFHYATRER
jgi:hypothetical protein